MKIFHSFFVLLTCFSVLAISCKKEKDSVPPEIRIISPVENNSYKVYDTIAVEAEISDEINLISTRIQLLKEDKTVAGSVLLNTLTKKSQTLKANYVISNATLSSGIYFLKVSASDGLNESNHYTKINISEVATIPEGIAIITLPSYSSINVTILDKNDSLRPFVTLSGNYAASCVSTRYQYINILGKISPGLNSYLVTNKTLQWNIPAIGAYPYFENMDIYNETSYVCHKNGTIAGYDKDGIKQFIATAASGYAPEKSFLHQGKLLVQEKKIAGTERQLAVYYNTGTLQHHFLLPFSIVGFAGKDAGNVFLFGNDNNGNAKILIYSLSGNISQEAYTIPPGNSIKDALQISSNTYLLAMQDALYKFENSPGNFNPFIAIGNVEKIKYDRVSDVVYCSYGNKLIAFNYGSAQQVKSYTHSGLIRDFHLLFNK